MSVTDHPHIQTLDRYLELLRNDDYEGAASQYTEDGVYLHSPMHQDDVRIEGRENIQKYFEHRGHQDIHHEIRKSVVDGDQAAIVGRITGDDVKGEEDFFISFAEFEDGRIDYYIAGLLKGK
jgi:ketosteroid isomerase-like protein